MCRVDIQDDDRSGRAASLIDLACRTAINVRSNAIRRSLRTVEDVTGLAYRAVRLGRFGGTLPGPA
jgi:hypothetical protein